MPFGISQTVYYNVHHPVTANASDSDLFPVADAVAAKDPQVVVIGTADLPSLLAFVHAFQAQHFTPKIFIASAGPDLGTDFLQQVGPASAEAIMVPAHVTGSATIEVTKPRWQ